jgi:hypothetical protein
LKYPIDVVTTLKDILSPFDREWQVILEAAEGGQLEAKSLPSEIAESEHGHYERVEWIKRIVRNKPLDSVYDVIKEKKRHNFLKVRIGNDTFLFAMYFAVYKDGDIYEVHNKGSEAGARPGAQGSLFQVKPKFNDELLLYYLLRVEVEDENGKRLELHFIKGDRPLRKSWRYAKISAVDKFIFRGKDLQPSTDTYEVPFDPEGIY